MQIINSQRIKDLAIGSAFTVLAFGVLIVALLPLDLRMQHRAIQQADRITERTWIKIAARPLVSKFYPNGNGGYVVHLRADDPSIPDEKLLVVDDDTRGQAFLALQNGCRIRAVRGDGQRFRSRSLAYNYLEPTCVSIGMPPDSPAQQ